MSSPSVAAIVLNYNAKQLTLETLESLRGLRYPNLHVIHVDNDSTDGTHEAVEEQFPEVEAIQSGENLGVAGGLNVGIRRALEGDYDYRVFEPGDAHFGSITIRSRVGKNSSELFQWWLDCSLGKNIRKNISVIALKRDGSEARRSLTEKRAPGDLIPHSVVVPEFHAFSSGVRLQFLVITSCVFRMARATDVHAARTATSMSPGTVLAPMLRSSLAAAGSRV